jgi:hypothetical protein
MPNYILTIAYTVENTEAHTALISAIVSALDDAPSELALTQATVVDDAGTVEDLLGPEAAPAADNNSTSPTEVVGDQPVAAPPQGEDPASESLPSGKEF